MKRLLPLVVLTLASAGAAQTVSNDPARALVTPDLAELPLRSVGRVQPVPLAAPMPKGAIGYRHQWPGIYWEARVRGSQVVLSFDDSWNSYRLWVDGAHPQEIAAPGHAQVAVTGMRPGTHALRLETLTESPEHPGTFEGFYAAAAASLPPPQPKPRAIEWIGDSSMAGYGDRSDSAACTSDQAHRLTDTQRAYSALVSQALGADYEVNAISGRGLVRNFGDFDEGHGLPTIYPFALHDRSVPADDRAWHPDLIVIRLWADFVGGLKPGERWANEGALLADYQETLGRFVVDLHRRSPGAAVLVWWFDAGDLSDPRAVGALDAVKDMVTASAHAAGLTRIAFAPTPGAHVVGTACDHHWGLAQHRAIADAVTSFLRSRPDLWPASPAAGPTGAPRRP